MAIIVNDDDIQTPGGKTRTIQISGDNVEVQIMNSRGWEDELAKHYDGIKLAHTVGLEQASTSTFTSNQSVRHPGLLMAAWHAAHAKA